MSFFSQLANLFSRAGREDNCLRQGMNHAHADRPDKAIEAYNVLLSRKSTSATCAGAGPVQSGFRALVAEGGCQSGRRPGTGSDDARRAGKRRHRRSEPARPRSQPHRARPHSRNTVISGRRGPGPLVVRRSFTVLRDGSGVRNPDGNQEQQTDTGNHSGNMNHLASQSGEICEANGGCDDANRQDDEDEARHSSIILRLT